MRKLLLTLAALVSTIAIVTATDIGEGDIVQLTNFGDAPAVPVAIDEDHLRAFILAGQLDETGVITYMIQTGKLLPVKPGTKVRIVNYGEPAQVRILEGKYSGRAGWVVQACLGNWAFED